MDYRQGKCSKCGAEYKIPASFQHNAAKCKECGGVVNMSPVTSGAGAAASGPVPARQFAGKRPDEQPKKKSGTLERLKAERAAHEAPKPSGTLEKLKAERAAAAAKAAPEKPPIPSAPQSLVHARGGTVADRARGGKRRASAAARKRGGEDDGDEGEATGRRGAHHRQPKKPPYALMGIGAVALIVAGTASYFMFVKEAKTQAKEAGDTAAQAPDQGTEAPADPTLDDVTTGMEDVPADATTDAAGETPTETPEAPKEKPKPEPKKGDPTAVDLLAYPDFPAPAGTTPAEWTELQDLVSAFLADDGAKSSRALRTLEGSGPKAVPAMLNQMKRLNLGDEHDYTMCSSLQRALTEIAHGRNYGWYNGQEDTPHYQNKRVVELWIKTWTQANEDIQAWITFAELETKAPEEATQLRETFVRKGAAIVKDDDDLDVD